MDLSAPPLRFFLVSVLDHLYGEQLHFQIAAYSVQDAEDISATVGYPVVVVDEIERPTKVLDNNFLKERMLGSIERYDNYLSRVTELL